MNKAMGIDQSKPPAVGKGGREKLPGELWIIIPFFSFALYIFLGSFQYKVEASTVPMSVGLVAVLLTGIRLIHLLFPQLPVGKFEETGLAEDFDHLKKKIETKTLGRQAAGEEKESPFESEKKPLIALIASFLIFLLFGYLVGSFLVVLGTSFFFGFRKKKPILVTMGMLFLIVWVILYGLLKSPPGFGLVLGPLLKALRLI